MFSKIINVDFKSILVFIEKLNYLSGGNKK